MEFTLSPPVDRLAATLPVGLLATKRCGGCKREKELDCFWVLRRAPDGLQPQCMECMKVGQASQRKYTVRARLEAQEARRILREEEEEKNAPSPQQIRFMARAIKLLGIRRLMESGRTDEAEFQGINGMHNEDWRDPFPGIKFVTRPQIEEQPRICDCPYWQHEIQHA